MVLTKKTENNNIEIEVISTDKKKFKRLVINGRVEWRRYKTNNQVTNEQQVALETEYLNTFSRNQSIAIGSTAGTNMKFLNPRIDSQRRTLETELVKASNNGISKLAGVKHVKERTGLGLLDSKLFVDDFFTRRNKFNNSL